MNSLALLLCEWALLFLQNHCPKVDNKPVVEGAMLCQRYPSLQRAERLQNPYQGRQGKGEGKNLGEKFKN
jgi:hypothetical protein